VYGFEQGPVEAHVAPHLRSAGDVRRNGGRSAPFRRPPTVPCDARAVADGAGSAWEGFAFFLGVGFVEVG
jgi:hypothetical protein